MKMDRGRDEKQYNGIVVVNKPKGLTSHDVVSRVRRIFHMRRVGHAGTLDPLATGVLIVLLGPSTKLFNRFQSYDKAYQATLILGTKTSTADIEGQVTGQLPYEHIGSEQVEDAFKQFVGQIEQVPPMVSAIKVKGKRLYEFARQGLEVERSARKIKIYHLRLLHFDLPRVTFYLECSKGTYVRQLAEDVGQRLGTVACIAEIERLKVGPFEIKEAVRLEDLTEQHIRPWAGREP